MLTLDIRRSPKTVLLLLAVFLWLGKAACAAEIIPFNQEKFGQAQNAGKTIMVDVHADWCSTCKKQKPVIEGLAKDKTFAGAVIFRVNFDSDKQALRTFHVRYQSTLIVFKGTEEKARSVAETDPGEIRALFEKGL